MTEERKFCSECNQILEKGATHSTLRICIQAYQVAMMALRRETDLQELVCSSRALSAIEELCLMPQVGVPYRTCFPKNPDDPMGEMVTELHYSQVEGVFKAIKQRYKELGSWSPLYQAREELYQEQRLNVEFQEVLVELEKLLCDGRQIPFLLRKRVRGLLDPGGLHLEADGPPEESPGPEDS